MDFVGQKEAEFLFQVILVFAGAVSFIVGYLKQDLMMTVYILASATIVCFLLFVPPCSLFNKNPVKWHAKVEKQQAPLTKKDDSVFGWLKRNFF
jgi:signal peptidase complex subunit 1